MSSSVQKSEPVTFKAQLVGIGDYRSLAEDLAGVVGDQSVLVFVCDDVEEARKAARLFRRKVTLTEGGER